MAYKNQVIPRLTKKNKFISIAVAVALSVAYLIGEMILKPPRNLRHIPYVGYFSIIKSMITNESKWNRAYRVHLAEIDKPNHKGLLLEPGPLGWEVLVSNPEDVKRILLKQDLFSKTKTSHCLEETLLGKFALLPNIVSLNGHAWKSQRNVANPAFHRSMPIKLFGNLTRDLFHVMETMDDIVDVTDLMERWTLNAIGKAGFGFDFNALIDKDNAWVNRYNSINIGMRDPKFFVFPKLDGEYKWLFPKREKLHKELELFKEMLAGVIEHKKMAIKNNILTGAPQEEEKDLLTLMIESVEEGNGILTDKELMVLLIFHFIGHDTTSNALSSAIHYLAENQDIQKKARDEATSILGDSPFDVLPNAEDIKRMTYINQVIKESLRINPPAVQVVPRVAGEDTELSGTFIPKGTLLTVSIFNLHHSAKVWNNPDKFDPERFSDKGENYRGPGEGFSWAPFGNGARQCIGLNFSLNEQRVLLSMLLRKFTWSTPDNSIHKNGLINTGHIVVGPLELDIKFCKRY
ncbi:cytochrome P450 [Mucor mucedo]|uniref:cytochrome P450 n=1 Tax=Mucor mucedo TaxID=29922 RepID=UPI002220A120|nr:cytochrome P450 [Mucor mucedo]KAI7873099.1 cytochrome P450 [Mucor mucedo]